MPAGNRALPRHAVKASLISVLEPDRLCIAGSSFPVTKVGDITPCTPCDFFGGADVTGYKRNITHTRVSPGTSDFTAELT